MTPLNNWTKLKRGYLFGQPTFYTTHHLGVDYLIPVGTPIRAPFDGVAEKFFGTEGGATIHFKTKVKGIDYFIRFLHLSQFEKLGNVKQGDIIGLSGNTGLSTAPHCHVDISLGSLQLTNFSNFRDPELFNWNPMTYTLKLTVLNKDDVFLNALNGLVKDYSNGNFNLSWKTISQPIVATGEILTGDESLVIINTLGIKDTAVLFYEGHTPSYDFASTSVNPLTKMPFIIAEESETPFFVSYEVSHALQKLFNEHRGSYPPIDIVDINIPTEALIRAKFATVIPYIPYLNSLESGTPDMLFRQVQVVGSKDVYLVRNGAKSLVFNADLLQIVGDFSKIETINQAEFDAIPASGITLAAIKNE